MWFEDGACEDCGALVGAIHKTTCGGKYPAPCTKMEGDLSSDKPGTCARKNSGKVSFSLVPFHLLAGTARVLMKGSVKYAPWNWAKGGKWSTPMDCLLRHLLRWWFMGEEKDQESGEHHLDHVMCNLLFLIHYRLTHKEGDDRPSPGITRFTESMKDFSALIELPGEKNEN